MSKPRLWGIGTSRTFRAHYALIERGVDYHSEVIRTRTSDQERADFRALAVSAKIPVYQDEHLVLSESAAIARHVMRLGRPPRPAAEQAFVDQWSFFMVSELDATALYVLRRHDGLPEIYGASETASRVAREYFLRQITALDEALFGKDRPADRDHLITGFSELDIILVSILDWATSLGIALPTNTCRYHDVQRARENYAAATAANFPRT